jgi:ketosteroid isomerase-like protein
VEGKDNYREYAKRFYGRHTKLEHKIIQAWETEDGMAIVELLATHTLTDGRSPSTPAMSQLTRRDGKIVRIKAFLDKSPFLPPT